MKNYTPSQLTAWTLSYTQTLGNLIDIWEIGNEVNGNWVGSTALTFFYEGEPSEPHNCHLSAKYPPIWWAGSPLTVFAIGSLTGGPRVQIPFPPPSSHVAAVPDADRRQSCPR